MPPSFTHPRSVHSVTPSPSNPLKRARTQLSFDDDAESSHPASRSAPEAEESHGDRRRKTLLADLFARSERMLGHLFRERAIDSQDSIGSKTLQSSENETSLSHTHSRPSPPPPTSQNRSVRKIDEDYGDDDEGEAEDTVDLVPSPPSSKDTAFLSRATTVQSGSSTTTLKPAGSNDPSPTEEDVRKKLEAEKKAAEDAAKQSFQTMFYTLENDRDAMLEQQKLDELDREVETDISEQQKGAPGDSDESARQGTLSSANLGASSLALKHLIAKVDAKRSLVKASDSQLRVLMSEVRKNRSKWANEDKIGQEELYESAERVLMDLKARTEYSAPFLQKVNKRDAPDYASIIKTPMDIGTMMKKLKQLQYHSKREFVDDLELIWSNCLKYNASSEHPLRRKAQHMQELTRNLTRLIPEIVIRNRADVEAEERRLHPDDDDADESEDEPLMSTRGRKAPGKTSKKGVNTTRKAPTGEENPSQSTTSEQQGQSQTEPLNAAVNLKSEHMRGEDDAVGDGRLRGLTEPLPTESTPAPPSQADQSEMDAVEHVANGVNGTNDEHEEDDEEYQTWKQVTKQDRARVAAERHRLFNTCRLNVEEPALLRTKGGMRRLLRLYNGPQAVDLPQGDVIEEAEKAIVSAATLAEGMDVDEDCILPDYYDALNNIPAVDDRLVWAEDSDGQIIQREEFLRALPTGLFDPPQGILTSKLASNMRQMQETRKIVAKIGIVKQMQLQAQTYQNQFQKYDPPLLRDVPIEATVVSDDDPVMPPQICRAALKRSVAKIFYHAGFEDFQPSAMEAATDLAGKYFADIASHLGFYHNAPMVPQSAAVNVKQKAGQQSVKYVPRFTSEEAVLHTLQAFSHDMNDIDSYVREDLDRLTSRLEAHHSRTRDYLADLLRPALDPASVGQDGVGAFNDGSDQFVGGDFAEELDEDFFGFRELGLDREFGLANLSVPLHLLQSRISNAHQPASANAVAGTGQLVAQPPPYPAITMETLNVQIGLVKEYFRKRLDANDDDPLIEDDELPIKQRYPKPRLPPTGKITSPRKRPIREQQQIARRKRRLEIEAEREREREREAGAAGLTVNGTAKTAEAATAGKSRPNGVTQDQDAGEDAIMVNGHSGDAEMAGVRLAEPEEDADKPMTPRSIGKLKLDMPQESSSAGGDPEKKSQTAAPDDRNGHGQDDAEGEEDDGPGMISPESLPIAAH